MTLTGCRGQMSHIRLSKPARAARSAAPSQLLVRDRVLVHVPSACVSVGVAVRHRFSHGAGALEPVLALEGDDAASSTSLLSHVL